MQVQYFFRNLRENVRNLFVVLGLKKSKSGNYYVSRTSLFAPWVYIAYIPEILCKNIDIKELMVHQNRQEMIAIVNIFNDLGYNAYIQSYSSRNPYFPKINVKIVFGLEPLFGEACAHYPAALKIYYATGAYYKFQNAQVHKMTDFVNQNCNCSLPYRRLVAPHNSVEIADKILQIGSKYTLQTYPSDIKSKITCIHQRTLIFQTPDIEYASENEFLFVASEGNILKGAFLLIEYFRQHPELTLNWVGPIEDDFWEVVRPRVTANIKTYGFLEWSNEEMQQIVKRCNYFVYPSGSDGTPGAVLCAMKCGLIPVVTHIAAFDEIDQYGFLIEEYSVAEIDKALKKALSLSPQQIVEKKLQNSSYINNHHHLKRFMEEFEMYIRKA